LLVAAAGFVLCRRLAQFGALPCLQRGDLAIAAAINSNRWWKLHGGIEVPPFKCPDHHPIAIGNLPVAEQNPCDGQARPATQAVGETCEELSVVLGAVVLLRLLVAFVVLGHAASVGVVEKTDTRLRTKGAVWEGRQTRQTRQMKLLAEYAEVYLLEWALR
jgi:hypothetical protein